MLFANLGYKSENCTRFQSGERKYNISKVSHIKGSVLHPGSATYNNFLPISSKQNRNF